MSSGSASAGAWVQNKGDAYVRASLAYEDHGTLEATRWDAYTEWGLSDNWTLTGKIEQVDFNLSDVFDSTGYRATARRKLSNQGAWVTSAELGILEGAAIGGFQGCESTGAELNFAVGRSGPTLIGDLYGGVMVGRREHSEGCYANRLEAVIGYTAKSGWIYTGQIWSQRGTQVDSDKIELIVSRKFGPFELGFGSREEISGEFDETAAIFSVSLKH